MADERICHTCGREAIDPDGVFCSNPCHMEFDLSLGAKGPRPTPTVTELGAIAYRLDAIAAEISRIADDQGHTELSDLAARLWGATDDLVAYGLSKETRNRQQALCAQWHADRFPDHDRWIVLAKLTEEVGELARAVIAEHENRPGRGVVAQEAAQVVLVLMTLIGRHYPDVDLLAEVQREYERVAGIPGHPGG